MRRGFTLIELLVVIAIIAMLLGMLMPALGAARRTARHVKCLANLRGIGTGLTVYTQNLSRGVLPHVLPLHDSGGNQNDPSLLDVLADQIDAAPPMRDEDGKFIVTDPWRCPEDKSSTDAENNFEPTWRTFGTSYEYVPGGLMLVAELNFAIPRDRVARVVTNALDRYPKEMPILVDAGNWHTNRVKGQEQKNALYYRDGRADFLIQPDVDSLGELMAEIARTGFGG